MSEMKRCSRCKNEYPATLEYFGKQRDVLHSWCRVCLREWDKYRHSNPQYLEEKRQRLELKDHVAKLLENGFQICSICHETKPLDEYYKGSKKSSGRKSMCKPCYSELFGWE